MSDEPMTAKEAIKYIAKEFNVPSRYAMSKQLSDEELTVQPIQISNYMNGTKMSEKVAKRFNEVYGVLISDIHYPSDFRRTSQEDI
jgi:hypothetical protein